MSGRSRHRRFSLHFICQDAAGAHTGPCNDRGSRAADFHRPTSLLAIILSDDWRWLPENEKRPIDHASRPTCLLLLGNTRTQRAAHLLDLSIKLPSLYRVLDGFKRRNHVG
jgi:hypothetical protein